MSVFTYLTFRDLLAIAQQLWRGATRWLKLRVRPDRTGLPPDYEVHAQHLEAFCEGRLVGVEYLHAGQVVVVILTHRDDADAWCIAVTRLSYMQFDALVAGSTPLRQWFPIGGQADEILGVKRWASGVGEEEFERVKSCFREDRYWTSGKRIVFDFLTYAFRGDVPADIAQSLMQEQAISRRQAEEKELRQRLREQTDAAMLARPERKRI